MQSIAKSVSFATVRRPAARSAARVGVRSVTSASMYGAARNLWLPGAPAPSYLDGTLAADFGFDPLGLGSDPERLKWYVQAELTNGRWAMAAVAGILFTDATGNPVKWFEAGAATYNIDTAPQLAVLFPVLGFLEAKRLQGYLKTGESGLGLAASDKLDFFPFDPLNMRSADMKTKEVMNARLAMLAFVGFAVQALVTREGPLANLSSHLANPTEANFIGSISNLPSLLQ